MNSLVNALVHEERGAENVLLGRRASGLVVGLTGQWGLGKSSVLNLLHQQLSSMSNVVVATFNPWLFSGRDELVKGFFSELRQAIGRSELENYAELIRSLDRYWKAIDLAAHATAASIDALGGGGSATLAWSWARKTKGAAPAPRIRSPYEERIELEKKLKSLNAAVVVLIDELDRVEDQEVRAVAQLVKAVGDIQGVSYLVAYDPDRVVQALGRGENEDRRRSGERYLEKIIQYPIPLRPLFSEDVQALLAGSLSDNGVQLPEARQQKQKDIFQQIKASITTPRDVKRLVGAFSILEHAVRGEICSYDILGYAWILTKSTAARDSIAHHIDAIVDDPSSDELSDRVVRRMNRESRRGPVDILGSTVEPFDKLLRLMFPTLAEGEDAGEGNNISKRRNLVRLLYLGNPPGMVRRSEVEEIWSISDTGVLIDRLQQLKSDGRLAQFIDRLDDLLPELSEAADTTFWPAIARLFHRDSYWIRGPEDIRSLADDAATALMHLGLRRPESAQRVRVAFKALSQSGDLVITPWILRKHLFAHGLTRHSDTTHRSFVFDLNETTALVEQEAPRYRAAVLDGTALRTLPTVEAIYVLGNLRRWDTELRSSFTGQLNSMNALSTLAALMVPPGYTTERSSLDELFDADAVQVTLDDIIAREGLPPNPWLSSSLKRLQKILHGNNPMFLDEPDD